MINKFIKKISLLSGIFIMVGVNTLFAQDSLRFTLEQAQAYALENGVNARNAELDIEAAKKSVWEATATGLPQISGKVDYQHVPGEIPEIDFGSGLAMAFQPLYEELDLEFNPAMFGGASPIAEKNSVTYSATVSQLVFSGEYIVALQASKTYLQLSQNQMELTELNVKENVASNYFSIRTFEESLMYLDSMQQNLQSTLSEMRRMREVGMVDRTDVDQIELSLKNIENQKNGLTRQRESLYMLLKIQMGLDVSQAIELTQPLNELMEVHDIDKIAQVDFNIENNVNYKSMVTQSEIAELNLKRERSKYLPNVSAFYSYTDRTNAPPIDFTINHVVGVNVSIPIFSSGQRMARVSQAKIELEKTRNQLEQTGQNIQMQVEQAKFEVNNALDQYYTAKYSLELSQRILNNTLKKHKEGMASSMDLSQANNQYLEAYTAYNRAVMELLTAKVKLNKLVNNL
ncbi:MAG: TolC family protein [Bacteroidetes bacterium]|jgi:outer membrane protein TolC|nr:TolC family protein [Bacteroidota bacterium]